MVTDQAARLRQMACSPRKPTGGCRVIVVRGAAVGCGSTTITLALGWALARRGRNIALVDAAPNAELSRRWPPAGSQLVTPLSDSENLIHEPGRPPLASRTRTPVCVTIFADQGRALALGRQLPSETDEPPDWDALLVDAGTPPNLPESWWDLADEWLFVSTPDQQTTLNCYAQVKLAVQHSAAPMRVVFNRVERASAVQQIYHGMARVCRHFLDRHLGFDGWLPDEEAGACWSPQAQPAQTAFARAVESLAARWLPRLTSSLRMARRDEGNVLHRHCPTREEKA